ncbi:hypothetical protein ACFYRG_23200 [Streptomyces mirabilis]|uniref:hypothetical protein n=1 Tax=Streptomyces mirabilis TaxID=68239 RepID=UPI00368B8FAE
MRRIACSREIDPWCARATTGGAPNATPDSPIASAGNQVSRPTSAGSARRDHRRVPAGGDGLPGAALRLGGCGERAGERAGE